MGDRREVSEHNGEVRVFYRTEGWVDGLTVDSPYSRLRSGKDTLRREQW